MLPSTVQTTDGIFFLFQAKDDLTDWEQSEAKTAMVYADPTRGVSGTRRPVSAISWCPDGGTKLAIGYCSPEFQGLGETTPVQGYTFAVEDPTKHCDTLTCPSPLTSLVDIIKTIVAHTFSRQGVQSKGRASFGRVMPQWAGRLVGHQSRWPGL